MFVLPLQEQAQVTTAPLQLQASSPENDGEQDTSVQQVSKYLCYLHWLFLNLLNSTLTSQTSENIS